MPNFIKINNNVITNVQILMISIKFQLVINFLNHKSKITFSVVLTNSDNLPVGNLNRNSK